MALRPFTNAAVAQAFEGYPPRPRRRLMVLRELIFRTAAATPGVGELDETLKWGEPAYVTAESGSGSTVRIAWKASRPTQYAMYVNCQTDLIETFKAMFPHDFAFEGKRAIVFEEAAAVPSDALTVCISAALTYHRRKATARSR
jgi:Domain of unknown function (DU1801)